MTKFYSIITKFDKNMPY